MYSYQVLFFVLLYNQARIELLWHPRLWSCTCWQSLLYIVVNIGMSSLRAKRKDALWNDNSDEWTLSSEKGVEISSPTAGINRSTTRLKQWWSLQKGMGCHWPSKREVMAANRSKENSQALLHGSIRSLKRVRNWIGILSPLLLLVKVIPSRRDVLA